MQFGGNQGGQYKISLSYQSSVNQIKSQPKVNSNQSSSNNTGANNNQLTNISTNRGTQQQQMLQPILRNKDNAMRKQSSSGSIDKKGKSSNNQVQQVFNYQEKTTVSNNVNKISYLSPDTKQSIFNEDQIIEVKKDQDNDFHNQSIRPHNEALAINNKIQEEKKDNNFLSQSSQQQQQQDLQKINARVNLSSFNPQNEKFKSESKDQEFYIENNNQNENFDIINEDVNEESNFEEIQDSRLNSDYKRFNDEDFLIEQNHRHNNQEILRDRYNLQKFKSESLSETPKEIKEKIMNNQNVLNETQQSLQLQDVSNQYLVQQQINNIVMVNQLIQEELILKQQEEIQRAQTQIFSSQNLKTQQNQYEYLPLQINEQIQQDRPIGQDSNQISEAAQIQQRRLNDILKSSYTEMSSLNNSIVQDKIDEKALNNMIEMEKNYVILQYENILQQLNVEFHKLLSKSKETDEALLQKDGILKTQARIIQEKEESQFQQEQINRQLTLQVQELLQELENMTLQRQQQITLEQNEAWKFEKDALEQKLNNLTNKLNLMEQNEFDLKDQLDVAQSKVRILEQRNRQKEEELFSQQIENQNFKKDVENMKDIETQLKYELSQICKQRISLENEIQDLKQQLSSQQLKLRQRDQEIENIVRENRNLRGSLEIKIQAENEILNENNILKETINEQEKFKLNFRGHSEQQEKQIRNMNQEIKKLQNSIDYERNSFQKMEEHYKAEIQKLINQQRQQAAQFQQSDNLNRVEYRQKEDKRVNFNDESNYRSNSSSYYNIQTSRERNDFQKLLEGRNPNYNQNQDINYSQNIMSPKNNLNDITKQKSSIMWTSSISPQSNISKSQQLNQGIITSEPDKFKQNSVTNLDETMHRRKTVQNQNESQLQNVLSWDQRDSGRSNQQFSFSQGKSLERNFGPQYEKNSSQNNSNYSFNPQSNMRNQSQQPQQQQNQQQLWQQNQNSNIYPPGHQSKQSLGANSQLFGKINNSSNNNTNNIKQDQDLQPAGKKSTIIQVTQSPLTQRNQNVEKQINHMQNSLCSLQMDKERIENEYRKLGHPKNKQQIEKKQELEFDIEIVNKNIQNLKQKLRELNAF